MPDELAILRNELRLLRAHAVAQDFILAALAAHLEAITQPGFLAAAFDSAAATASRMSLGDHDDVMRQARRHIEQMRSALSASATPPTQQCN